MASPGGRHGHYMARLSLCTLSHAPTQSLQNWLPELDWSSSRHDLTEWQALRAAGVPFVRKWDGRIQSDEWCSMSAGQMLLAWGAIE